MRECAVLSSFSQLSSIRDRIGRENHSGGDTIDFDNGTMTIQKRNLNKYLEKYACKDEDDLKDTLWYNYGIFVRIDE